MHTYHNIANYLFIEFKMTPELIKKTRKDAGLTQAQAAALIYKNIRTWQQWEAGDRKMDKAYWELFLINVKI